MSGCARSHKVRDDRQLDAQCCPCNLETMSIWTAPIRIEDEGRRPPARNAKEDHQMKQYLLSGYHPEGEALAPEVQDKAGRDVDALNQPVKAAGTWVSAGGLRPCSTAAVLRVQER